MSTNDIDFVIDAMRGLTSPRLPVAAASERVPKGPGLYAMHSGPEGWLQLGLEERGIPLYVGMSDDNVSTRVLKTHFASGRPGSPKTGSSTLRRSLAALLREPLNLHGVPRNKARPESFSLYALEPDAEDRLTTWMNEHLTIAAWAKPDALPHTLMFIQDSVIEYWEPPLNIAYAAAPLKRLVDARALMTAEAEEWARAHNPEQQGPGSI